METTPTTWLVYAHYCNRVWIYNCFCIPEFCTLLVTDCALWLSTARVTELVKKSCSKELHELVWLTEGYSCDQLEGCLKAHNFICQLQICFHFWNRLWLFSHSLPLWGQLETVPQQTLFRWCVVRAPFLLHQLDVGVVRDMVIPIFRIVFRNIVNLSLCSIPLLLTWLPGPLNHWTI